MILLNPKKYQDRNYPDERSKEIMTKTIEWFESKGLQKMKEDYRSREFTYDFADFIKKKKFLKPCFYPRVMVMMISITAPIECMSFLKSRAFTGQHTGICSMYPLWDLILCSWETTKNSSTRRLNN